MSRGSRRRFFLRSVVRVGLRVVVGMKLVGGEGRDFLLGNDFELGFRFIFCIVVVIVICGYMDGFC